MSISDYSEKPESPTFTEDDSGQRTYVRTFWVTCSTRNDGPLVAISAPIIPSRGQFYNFRGTDADIFAICRSISCKPDVLTKTGRRYEVVANYSTKAQNPEDQQDNPLDTPPELAYTFERQSVPCPKDKDNEAIKNSAEDPFVDPVDREDARLTLVYVRNEPFFDAATAIQYVNAVNKTEWNGGAPRTWKCNQISGTAVFGSGMTYSRTRYEFSYKHDTFDLKILDLGFRELAGGVKWPILNPAGDKITEPAFLDGEGVKLDVGDDPVYRTFEVYQEMDFNNLGLEV